MKIKLLKSTICLLSSMITGGEKHSDVSREMVKEALDHLTKIEDEKNKTWKTDNTNIY